MLKLQEKGSNLINNAVLPATNGIAQPVGRRLKHLWPLPRDRHPPLPHSLIVEQRSSHPLPANTLTTPAPRTCSSGQRVRFGQKQQADQTVMTELTKNNKQTKHNDDRVDQKQQADQTVMTELTKNNNQTKHSEDRVDTKKPNKKTQTKHSDNRVDQKQQPDQTQR